MPTSQLMKKCVECNKMTMHLQEKPNYILHIILSILTAGVWLLVWLLFINAKDPQCSICGRSNDFLGNFNSMVGIAENLANYEMYFGDANLINTELDRYLKVTKEDIQRVAKKYFKPSNRVVLYYLPKAG